MCVCVCVCVCVRACVCVCVGGGGIGYFLDSPFFGVKRKITVFVLAKRGLPSRWELLFSFIISNNPFINVNAWDRVPPYIRARGSCIKRMTEKKT